MILSKETKLDILKINLEALTEDDKKDAVIKIDSPTLDLWYDHLIELERYEECQILKNHESIIKCN